MPNIALAVTEREVERLVKPKLIIGGGHQQGDFVEWAGCTTKPHGIAAHAASFSMSLCAQCA
jgi:hypothetical protein